MARAKPNSTEPATDCLLSLLPGVAVTQRSHLILVGGCRAVVVSLVAGKSEVVVARVVGVHGAFHQLWGPNQIKSRWLPALQDGLVHAGTQIDPDDFAVAFYGDVFRPAVAAGRPDREELTDIARRSGLMDVVEEHYGPGGMEVLAEEVGREVLRQLLHQLGRYFADRHIRESIRSRLREAVTNDTAVIVAHSMGTVVAYEELVAHPEWNVNSLVTLGSPLGGEFVFPHLDPEPVDGVGSWPGAVAVWTNVVALDDTVVRVPELTARFGSGVKDNMIDNGHRAHDAEPYLNAPVTGAAIAAALVGDD